jgi:hypothetical protein
MRHSRVTSASFGEHRTIWRIASRIGGTAELSTAKPLHLNSQGPPGDVAHQGGFAAAGRTQQTQELAIGDFEVELAQLGTAEAR